MNPPFESVLIANRGEIALRVLRTCREMGIRTVVVHSTADRDTTAVRLADETMQIGPAAPGRSYLSAPAIVEAALRTGAQAIHPGYGFLSEDPDFADICRANGLVFVGPGSDVMAALADKAAARHAMAAAGLPTLPGSARTVDNTGEALGVADAIGFPVIIKAAAGGGGRGMSIVRDRRDFVPAYRSTRRHAQAVFGDGRVYLERYCERARHVEAQILADGRGTVLHLGTRDCSVQRRHQKLVEEGPATSLPAGMAEEIAEAAVRGAKAVGYTGAGTFEFLVHDDGFTFMEINCRIQVEHPVTEMLTGIDIVREQLRVAAGLPLSADQPDIEMRGVAVECRINAEDPLRDFAPCAGVLDTVTLPGGPFVRVDTHAYPGWRVPSEYDSLLAKIITWGPDRDQALDRMDRALGETRITGRGVHVTTDFLRGIVNDPTFRAGTHTTGLLAARPAA